MRGQYKDSKIFNEPTDLMIYRFEVRDCYLALAVAVIAFLMGNPFPTSVTNPQGELIGGLFSACVYLVFKAVLPIFLHIRVADLLRHRLSFLLLAMAGALGVAATSAYHQVFTQLNQKSIGALASAFSVLLTMRFIRKGDRSLLALAYFIIGSQFIFGIAGLFSLVGVFLTLFTMQRRLTRITLFSLFDNRFGAMCLEDARQLRLNMAVAGLSRILCALSFLFGAGFTFVFLRFALKDDESNREFVRGIVDRYVADLGALSSPPMLALLVATVFVVALAVGYSRRATDIYSRLSNSTMFLYAAILCIGLANTLGIVGMVPFLKGCDSPSSLLFASFLISGATMIAAAVFMVELGCRQYSGNYYGDDELARVPIARVATRARMNRALGFVLAVFAIMVLAPQLSQLIRH